MTGIEHFTFHLGGPTELMMAGSRFQQKGYQTFWGPGRHQLGSNWFWYFNSPLGCHIEYDADMDQHDDHWQPREALPGADNSQYFLLGYREKWAPVRITPADGSPVPCRQPAEGARGFDPTGSGQATVIACRYQGMLYLWRNRCPHQNTPMNWRQDAFSTPGATGWSASPTGRFLCRTAASACRAPA